MDAKEIAMNYPLADRLSKLEEECDEFTGALADYDEAEEGSAAEKRAWYHVLEELADVEIVLEQVRYHLFKDRVADDKLVDRIKAFKIERQALRIEMGDETWAGRRQTV